jgi:putative membrane protein
MRLTFRGRPNLNASSTILIAFAFVLGILSIGWIFAQAERQPSPPQARTPAPPALQPRIDAPSASPPGQALAAAESSGILQNFLTHAYYHGKAELYMAQMASTHAASPEVKQFAALVISDHNKVDQQMFSLAKTKGIAIDQQYRVEENPLYEAMISHLAQLSGPDFDQAYLEQTAENHTLELTQYLSLASAASDASTQLFAAQQVARVRDRLRRAKQILRESSHEITA